MASASARARELVRETQKALHPNRGTLWDMGEGSQGSAFTCVTSSRGITQVSPPAVKLQKTRKASRAQPWLGSTQYSPVG